MSSFPSFLSLAIGPSFSLRVTRRSGFAVKLVVSLSSLKDGAALTRPLVPLAPFFLFRAEGTNAVLSFFRSLNCGSALMTADEEADIP